MLFPFLYVIELEFYRPRLSISGLIILKRVSPIFFVRLTKQLGGDEIKGANDACKGYCSDRFRFCVIYLGMWVVDRVFVCL